MAEERMRC